MHSGKELIRLLKQKGYAEVSTKGSHVKLRNGDGTTVTVPCSNSQFPKGTYYHILKVTGVKRKNK